MKKFLLLRNNRESGPYTMEELQQQGLQPLDLVWIENLSVLWKYPGEIDELKDLVQDVPLPRMETERKPPSGNRNPVVFVSMPAGHAGVRRPEVFDDVPPRDHEPELETRFCQPLEVLKENYRKQPERSLWTNKLMAARSALNIAAIFGGVVIGAIVIRGIVENSAEPAIPEETTLVTPRNFMPAPAEAAPDPVPYQNALATEVVIPEKPVKKVTVPKTVKLKDIRKLVSVKSNAYRTGLVGGIENLQLTLQNRSAHMVDRVTVEVEYLKRNGEVVRSETVDVFNVKPNSTRQVDVPPSNRGVKVNVRVLSIAARMGNDPRKQI